MCSVLPPPDLFAAHMPVPDISASRLALFESQVIECFVFENFRRSKFDAAAIAATNCTTFHVAGRAIVIHAILTTSLVIAVLGSQRHPSNNTVHHLPWHAALLPLDHNQRYRC
jgi:hypothetical protein